MPNILLFEDIGNGIGDGISLVHCKYCKSKIEKLSLPEEHNSYDLELKVCQFCGWWTVNYRNVLPASETEVQLKESNGILRKLDLVSLETPIEELCTYMNARCVASR